MTQSLTDHIQTSRFVVVDVKHAEGRLRVRGEADVCTELACSAHTLVVTDEDTKAGLDALNPGDISRSSQRTGAPKGSSCSAGRGMSWRAPRSSGEPVTPPERALQSDHRRGVSL